MKIGSWVIVRISDGTPVAEVFTPSIVAKIDRDHYKAVPIGTYLSEFNRQIKKKA